MGEVAEAIRRKLDAAFAPQKLDVVDESDKHAGHSGARGRAISASPSPQTPSPARRASKGSAKSTASWPKSWRGPCTRFR
jgi:hypothetical protein